MENNENNDDPISTTETPYYNDGRLVVLNVWSWFHQKTNLALGGLVSQVTYCKYDGMPFYVRENLTGISSFFISSGERWGDRVGAGKPRFERQVLELLAHPRDWKMLSAVVRQYDSYNRPVLWNKRFNATFIKKLGAPEKDIFEALKRPRSYKHGGMQNRK